MSHTRHVALSLALALFAGTACTMDLGPSEVCLHSEGCDGGGNWLNIGPFLSFNGLVTSSITGEPLAGVTVLIEAPARDWRVTVSTNQAGSYWAMGPSNLVAGDCDGLSVSFNKEGYQPRQVTDHPELTCQPEPYKLSTTLTPMP